MAAKRRKQKICVVTGSRAEYGILYPLLKQIVAEPTFELQLAVTAAHLAPEFGFTFQEILDDGFQVDEKIEMLLSSDTEVGIAKSVGLGIIGMADAFDRLHPDLLVLLGDRYEIFAAAICAHIARVPIAHLGGGDLTEGSIDDAIRHSITKMSSLHFVALEEHRRRAIQLGEEPERVFTVGALGIDNIANMQLLSRAEIERELGFTLGERSALVTFHPVTLENDVTGGQFAELLGGLATFSDIKLIFSKPNADTHSRVIVSKIDEFVAEHPGRSVAFTSLGNLRYLSLVNQVDFVIGNSSSGITEVPSFRKPTVNIGDRQQGRIRAESVIDCPPKKTSIIKAVKKALSPEFQELCKTVTNPYGDGHGADRVMKILKERIGTLTGTRKIFRDLDY